MLNIKLFNHLRHPGSEEETDFQIRNNRLVDRRSGKDYPIINGMIDFQGLHVGEDTKTGQKKGLMFKLNTFFSNHLECRILFSIFTAGGAGFTRARKKMLEWHNKTAQGTCLVLNPEDHKMLAALGSDIVTVEDLADKNVLPAPGNFPDVNADMERLPFKTNSFQNILAQAVIEHVRHPRRHFQELSRILKPGGYLLLFGPGDVYPSHRLPFNYFNTLRHGYFELARENDLEIVEEFFPGKSWVSLLYLLNTKLVRHESYNKNQLTKLLHLSVFSVFFLLSPVLNTIAMLLDAVTPFDNKVYMIYLTLMRKKGAEEG